MFMGEEDLGTFLSRDAGRTWNEVKKGGWLYAFGDHGGVIVMVPDQREAAEVLYSLDEGLTWQQVPVDPFIASAIISPSDKKLEGTSLRFLIMGKTDETSPQGVILNLDLGELKLRQCVGKDAPDTKKSDYEKWNLRPRAAAIGQKPTAAGGETKGHTQEECLLGRAIIYMRRKRSSRCFNGLHHDKRVSQEPCACVESDFECDYGYSLKSTDQGKKECVWDAGELSVAEQERLQDLRNLQSTPALKHELCNRYANETAISHELHGYTGYRKIPGDMCDGGLNKAGQIHKCTGPLISIGPNGWFIFMLVLITGVCGAGAMYWSNTASQSSGYRAKVHEYEQDEWEREGLFSSAAAGGDGGYEEDYSEAY